MRCGNAGSASVFNVDQLFQLAVECMLVVVELTDAGTQALC
jgi:hypothetical protein